MKKYILIAFIVLTFSGCIVGDVVALPFRVTGAVLNTVVPDIVGNTITEVGETADTVIPF
ncbi:MAG: lipoprotein [Arcobacter sp.]|nr:lipoprotein [Arcobacter sp.]